MRGGPATWWDHPAVAAQGPLLRGRIGVAPNHPSFRLGVLRTHLLSSTLLATAAKRTGRAFATSVRWDDTDADRTSAIDVSELRRQLVVTAGIRFCTSADPYDPGTELRQSTRHSEYAAGLERLRELGVVSMSGLSASLDVAAADSALARAGVDPEALARSVVVNPSAPAAIGERATVRLTREDGRALWHLATVVDDIALGVNVIVRAADKLSAVAVHERIRQLLAPGSTPVAYLFVPRLIEVGSIQPRVASVLAGGVRARSLRAYLAEPFCEPTPRPLQNFDAIVAATRSRLPALVDGRVDLARLAAIDRKVSSAADSPASELAEFAARQVDPDIVWVTRAWARPLPAQLDFLDAVTGRRRGADEAPSDISDATEWLARWLKGPVVTHPPPGVRWLLTGHRSGPSANDLLNHLGRERAARLLNNAETER